MRGCDHPFCVNCILNWALQKPKCPLCNTKFTHLWVYRMLDGTYNDFLVEEHVDMLHQTLWFKKKVASDYTLRPPDDDDDEYHEQLQYMYGGGLEAEDEQAYWNDMEDGLVARRGGRRAIGNRLFGSGGVVNAGRQQARARLPSRTPTAPNAKSTKGFGVSSKGGSSAEGASSSEWAPEGGSSAADGGGYGSGSSSSGKKKAMQKAEKAAMKEAAASRRREMAQVSRGSSK